MAVAFRDYYESLGVDRKASEQEIRRAYRELARKHHPDVSKESGADDRFKEISEAYEVLRDTEKREKYDRLGKNWRAGDQMPPGAGGGFRGDGFSGFGDGVRVDFGGGGGGDFSDFFESFFGGARTAPRRADTEALLELSVEEAVKGGTRRIALSDGREFEVTIPAGVTDGQRLRVGDEITLRVRVKPDKRWRVKDRDLYTDLPVAPWEAALGATVELATPKGTVKVTVPSGSSSGRKLRLRGEGMPGPRGGHGDLYATVKIVVPPKPTKKERELFEQLAKTSKFNPRAKR